MKKTYSVDVQEGVLVSIEIDGVIYNSTDEIPEAEDRAHVERLYDDAYHMEIEKEREAFLGPTKPSKMPLILFLLFLSIAVLLLVISAFSTVSAIRSMGKEQSLPGQVVAMTERRSSSGRIAATRSSDRSRSSTDGDVYYYPEVEITFPDQTTKKLQLSQGSWPPAYEVGQPVTVLYNPEQPRDASIQSSGSAVLRFLPALIMVPLSLGFIGAALLVRWISKPDRAEEQKSKLLRD